MYPRNRRQPKSTGFTLVEVLFAVMILGMCIVAVLGSIHASTMATIAGTEMTQAVILAQGLREWTMNLPWNDPDVGDAGEDEVSPGPNGSSALVWVDDINDLLGDSGTGVTYSPPLTADGPPNQLDDLTGWSEVIDLTWRDPANVQTVVTDGASDVIYVQVTFVKDGESILTTGWIVTRRDED